MARDNELEITVVRRLSADLDEHWNEQQATWDSKVESAEPAQGELGLWDEIPNIDSKEVARMTHIFEKHLGSVFDIKHIRAGGYEDVDDLIEDIVPKLTGAQLPATYIVNTNGGSDDDNSNG